MSSARDCYLFDGTCACSKDADFTLTFDDGSCLKTSKLFLELASPVLKTAIGECQHDGSLHLTKTSKDTWILILNYMHPAGRSVALADSIAQYCRTSQRDFLEKADVLRQCEKFGLSSLKEDIDGRLASVIDAMNPISNTVSLYDKHRYTFMDCDLGMFAAVKEFDLPKTEEAVVAYLLKVVEENQECRKARVEIGQKPDDQNAAYAMDRITRVLREVHNAGRHRLGSLFAQATVEQGLLLS